METALSCCSGFVFVEIIISEIEMTLTNDSLLLLPKM